MNALTRRLLHKYGMKLAHFLMWLDGKMPSFGDLSANVYDWLETHHLCCERHGYKEDNA